MTHTRGRQAIGVNQPPGSGSLYPFVQPSADIQNLLGDFFLSFEVLRNDVVVYPLRIVWLYGFGDVSVPAPEGWPTPQHSHDLVVMDDNGLVVFDSTVSDSFTSSTWDDRLLILEWVDDDAVCRCVTYTQWTAADEANGQTQTYDQYIVPENGELQADCWYQQPKRVRSIQMGLTEMRNRAITLVEGYNVALSQVSNPLIPVLSLPGLSEAKQHRTGGREVTRIRIDAIPGSGRGVFPGCVGQTTVLRTFNRIGPDSSGNFTFDADGCLQMRRPLAWLHSSPGLPFPYFTSYEYPLGTTNYHVMQLANTCTQSCCSCEYFARTYQGLKRQWGLYYALTKNAERTRDFYADNRERWLAEKQLRETENLRVRIAMDGNCKVRWGVAFCNTSKCCLTGLRLYLFFMAYMNGEFFNWGWDTYINHITEGGPAQLENSSRCSGPEEVWATLQEDAPGFFAYNWDYADPQSMTTLCGRICMHDAFNMPIEAVKVRVWAGVSWEGVQPDPADGIICSLPTTIQSDIPLEVQQAWERAGLPTPITIHGQQASDLTIVEKQNPYCKPFNCGPEWPEQWT